MNLPRLTCSVRSVSWESDTAAIGDEVGLCAVVRLTAARSKDAPSTPVRKDFEVEFKVSEYSGRPPSQGGGSVSRELDIVKCVSSGEVMPGKSVEIRVTTKWRVEGIVEHAPEGDLPEFRCQACISGNGPYSKLLRIGSISAICWQQLNPATKPQNTKSAEFWFQDIQRVGLCLEGTGMRGFTANFRVFSDPDDAPASANRLIQNISGVPVEGGTAQTEWGMTEAQLPAFSYGNFKFDVILHHNDIPTPIALHRYRSRNIRHTATAQVCFLLYYACSDSAFKRASGTLNRILADKQNDNRFKVVTRSFRSELDFVNAWRFIVSYMKQFPDQSRIVEGHILSHASLGSRDDGLEFDPGTLSRAEIRGLPALPWASDATLTLHGCNTAVEGSRGWCPAQEFAKTQRVRTIGQQGYAFFSGQDERHSLIPFMSMHAGEVHLWAYDRSHNNINGDGRKLPGKEFLP